jgi:hypothetical protein
MDTTMMATFRPVKIARIFAVVVRVGTARTGDTGRRRGAGWRIAETIGRLDEYCVE